MKVRIVNTKRAARLCGKYDSDLGLYGKALEMFNKAVENFKQGKVYIIPNRDIDDAARKLGIYEEE